MYYQLTLNPSKEQSELLAWHSKLLIEFHEQILNAELECRQTKGRLLSRKEADEFTNQLKQANPEYAELSNRALRSSVGYAENKAQYPGMEQRDSKQAGEIHLDTSACGIVGNCLNAGRYGDFELSEEQASRIKGLVRDIAIKPIVLEEGTVYSLGIATSPEQRTVTVEELSERGVDLSNGVPQGMVAGEIKMGTTSKPVASIPGISVKRVPFDKSLEGMISEF